MNIILLKEIYDYNFSLEVINSLKQYWKKTRTFSCLGSPKKTDLLLYLDGVSAEYTKKDGTKIIAEKGSLIYTPKGSEYKLRLFDFDDDTSNTVGINFCLYDKKGFPFILENDILVFKGNGLKNLIEKIDRAGSFLSPCPALMKSGLYDIFADLSQKKHFLDKKYRIIEKGILLLEEDRGQDFSIKELAKVCNVSEIYFRKLFKEYAGKSPAEYRLDKRIEKAKEYLLKSDLSVSEIAFALSFTDTAYFCKQFKARTKLSPLQYRKQM